ncbi:hypothetical protein MBANPS3_007082 [Mucor bainieri]
MSTTERAQSDLKKLKSKYNSQLSTLKELFTEWTDDDLLFTLQDADGDLELAIDRISEGHASQWGEVKTKKSKKEAAAANKANLETSVSTAAPSTATYPSYSNTTSRQNKPLKPRSSAASTSAAAAPSSRSAHHPKPHAVAWQSSKKADFDGWNTPHQKTDDGNGWNTVESSAPKKIASTPSSSTKTSNAHGGGAKTWASLLQSKAEPEPVKKPVTNDLHDASEKDLPPLQKVDDAWLSGPTPANDSLNQWDQPIQETSKSSLSPPSPPQATASTSSTTATTTTTTQPQIKKTLDDDIPIDFNSLSLKEKENVPEVYSSSNHPSVADLLNSVKQQDQTPTSQPVQPQATEQQPQPQPQPQSQQQQQQQQQQPQQQTYHQQQQPTEQQLYHQMYQQQQQQQQYQQFGMHGYGNAFNAGYGIYGNSTNGNAADSFFQPSSGLFNNHQQHHENETNVNNATKATSASTTTATTTAAAANGGIPAVNDMYSQQSQYSNMQSFYPYYYMQNQFNAYPSYGQPSLNQRYDQSGAGNLANSMASPYGGASSAYSSQLYGGFDDFGLGSAAHQNTTATSPDANKKATPSTAASATSSVQQPYANYFNGQSPMFSSYGQQNRNSGNQQYWNQ